MTPYEILTDDPVYHDVFRAESLHTNAMILCDNADIEKRSGNLQEYANLLLEAAKNELEAYLLTPKDLKPSKKYYGKVPKVFSGN